MPGPRPAKSTKPGLIAEAEEPVLAGGAPVPVDDPLPEPPELEPGAAVCEGALPLPLPDPEGAGVTLAAPPPEFEFELPLLSPPPPP